MLIWNLKGQSDWYIKILIVLLKVHCLFQTMGLTPVTLVFLSSVCMCLGGWSMRVGNVGNFPWFRNLPRQSLFLPSFSTFVMWREPISCGILLFQIGAFGSRDICPFVTFTYISVHVVTRPHPSFACLYFEGGRFPNGLDTASEDNCKSFVLDD